MPATAYVTGLASTVSAIVTIVPTHIANNGTLAVSLPTLLNVISLAGFPIGSAWAYVYTGIATAHDGVVTKYDRNFVNKYGLTVGTHI